MPLSDIATVSITTVAAQIQAAGFGVPLIADAHAHNTDLIRYYNGSGWAAALVADGFVATEPGYLAAAALMAQNPQPTQFAIGRRANLPTVKYTIIPVAANNQKYTVTVNGVAKQTTASDGTATVGEICDLLVTALAAISGVTTALVGASPNGTAVTLTATVAGSAGAFQCACPNNMQAPTQLLQIQQTNADPGLGADMDAILAADAGWYGWTATSASNLEVAAGALWTESNGRLFIPTVQDGLVITSSGADIATTLKTAAYARTAPLYHQDPYSFAGAAWLGARLTTNPGAANWNFAKLAGVAASSLTGAQVNYAKGNGTTTHGKNASVYYTIGGINMVQGSTVSDTEWIDVVRDRDWFASRLQQRMANALTSNPKVPYTDGGIGVLEAEVRGQCDEGVKAGFLAANPAYTVVAPTALGVSSTDRNNRVLNGLAFSARVAGAINMVNLTGTLTI
jgi:hypothetical protein